MIGLPVLSSSFLLGNGAFLSSSKTSTALVKASSAKAANVRPGVQYTAFLMRSITSSDIWTVMRCFLEDFCLILGACCCSSSSTATEVPLFSVTGQVQGSMKYLNLDNSDFAHKKSPYGAECFKGGVLGWVEGYLDAIALKECGITAVASGTASRMSTAELDKCRLARV